MSPVNLRERDLGISASRHPVGDLTCFMGWLYGVAFCAIGRAGKEREAHLQRGVGIEQLGTGRVEDPFWKAVADFLRPTLLHGSI